MDTRSLVTAVLRRLGINKPRGHFPGPFLMLSAKPPIMHVKDWVFRCDGHPLYEIFDALRQRRAYFLISLSWTYEQRPEAAADLKRMTRAHVQSYPGHRLIFLCPNETTRVLFERTGLEAVLCSPSSFCDERLYRPLNIRKRHDAIYDARISVFKRHPLAAQIRSLALISKKTGEAYTENYAEETRRLLAHAHWCNDPYRPGFRVLTPIQVNKCLNRARVGLCLSAEEGAMKSSAQYLMAGLPVVSTPSIGGRDVFYDVAYAKIVEPEPAAVAAGVEEMIARNIPPDLIRGAVMERVWEHRRRLFELVQSIYRAEGIERDFAEDWPRVFRNYLLDPDTSHHQIIARMTS